MSTNYRPQPSQSPTTPRSAPLADDPQVAGDEQKIPVHGFRQVVEMLRVADPSFRNSLLRRIAARDPRLAKALAAELSR